MPKPRLRPTREAAQVLGVSFATVKNWIYKGKLRTVKTLGGHHRILEEDIEQHLRLKLAKESRQKWRLAPAKISEGNQLLGRVLGTKVDGLIAQVTILVGDHELNSIITADEVSELELKMGENVITLLKSSQIMILREPI